MMGMASYHRISEMPIAQEQLDEEIHDDFRLKELIETYIKHETDIDLPEGDDHYTRVDGTIELEIPDVSGSPLTVEITDPFNVLVSIRDADAVRWEEY